jgi:hypothetical protein
MAIQTYLTRIKSLFEQGCYLESLNICLQIVGNHPQAMDAWSNAAVNCIMLGYWHEAIHYAQTALAGGRKTLSVYDVLASAYGEIEQFDKARYYGLLALDMRARECNGEPALPLLKLGPMPPLPNRQTRKRNIIAFSLFGENPKYCETAILNAQDQPKIYPYWTCRFYTHSSVPEHVIDRLRSCGAEIVQVNGPAMQWPGQMWRLLALNDPLVHRILFRDTDSLISSREAAAVEQWLTSGKRFHIMRDWYSHTELILAGMWGIVQGSLPSLEKLVAKFINTPLESTRTADQHFLRQYVWPYACSNMMQHDSVFGFMGGVPFPDKKSPSYKFRVGYSESASIISIKVDQPDGLEIIWELYIIEALDGSQSRKIPVCAYPGKIKNGTVQINIPNRFHQWITQGTANVRIFPLNNTKHLIKIDAQDGHEVIYNLYQIKDVINTKIKEKLIYSNSGIIKNGIVELLIPPRYAQWERDGYACMRLIIKPHNKL